jgi:L-cystine uptake protein TcyP (sodium:dicarboxylate symporter family)
MQADSKYAIVTVVLVFLFVVGTAFVPALRVLVLPVIFVCLIALLYRAARPHPED